VGLGVAIWPSPVNADACFQAAGFTEFDDVDDAWDLDFATLVADVVALLSPLGATTVRACELVPARSLDRLLRRGNARPSTPRERLLLAAEDKMFGECEVEFGAPIRAAACTSNGHPIVWLWARDLDPQTWLASLARGRPLVETRIDLAQLRLPAALGTLG
jgi:hypothetical protein